MTYSTNIKRFARAFHGQHALLFVIGFKDTISLFSTTLPRPFRCVLNELKQPPFAVNPPLPHTPHSLLSAMQPRNDFPNALSCTEPRRSFGSFTRAIAINYDVTCVL